MRNDFAAMILSHGRAHNVKTYEALKKGGYTGKIYIIIDTDDKQADEYFKLFGDQVVQFNKADYVCKFDTGDNFDNRKVVVYARNASWDIAKKLGIKFFVQFDDDYVGFYFRRENINGSLRSTLCTKRLDDIFEMMIQFLVDTNALTVAFAQAGDFIGGATGSVWKKRLLRKAMNSFFLRTDRPFEFKGTLNDDVNTYVGYGIQGEIIFTITDFMVNQIQTQKIPGGATDIYLALGTYVKSFYTVMFYPSAAMIAMMGPSSPRIHHNILWDHCVPKILNEGVKKRG